MYVRTQNLYNQIQKKRYALVAGARRSRPGHQRGGKPCTAPSCITFVTAPSWRSWPYRTWAREGALLRGTKGAGLGGRSTSAAPYHCRHVDIVGHMPPSTGAAQPGGAVDPNNFAAWNDDANWTKLFGQRIMYRAASDSRILVRRRLNSSRLCSCRRLLFGAAGLLVYNRC